MTATSPETYEAQRIIDEANAQHEQREHAQKVKLLSDMREQVHEFRAEYDVLERNLRSEDEQRIRLKHEVRNLQYALNESEADKPAVADYLPNDKEVRAWQREHDRLTKALDETVERLKQVPQSDRLRYVKLGHDIQTLAYRIDVVVADLNGTLGKVERGTLNYVP